MGNWVLNHVFPYWRSFVVVLVPLLLLPLPLIAQTKEASCGYIILVMALYWMTEALPLAVTSLIPVVFFPLLGIMDTSDVCMAYMKETNMMFIGGLMLASAIEYCNLHKRIALSCLMVVGSTPRWLMLGFMVTTAFLSMWISNTATTAMMVPIVEAVVKELQADGRRKYEQTKPSSELKVDEAVPFDSNTNLATLKEEPIGVVNPDDLTRHHLMESDSSDEGNQKAERMRLAIMLSIAYASNIGGTGTLIGTGTQLAFKGIFDERFPNQTDITFASWMAFNIPGVIINLLIAWIWLQILFMGFSCDSTSSGSDSAKRYIRQKYKDLGRMTFHEAAVLFLFITCVMLWFFRDPGFITGWANLIAGVEVGDATAVMLVVLVLFSVPAEPRFWCLGYHEENKPEKTSNALLDWKYVEEKIPWGIVFLIGAGMALSDATQESGLSAYLADQLTALASLSTFSIMLIVCIFTAMITEVASNTATANIILPILADTAVSIRVNPVALMVPATVTCSYAFMLPVATPPNAIVYAAAKMKPVQMMKAGILMNILCVLVICGLMMTLGDAMFNIDTFPDWANVTVS